MHFYLYTPLYFLIFDNFLLYFFDGIIFFYSFDEIFNLNKK